METVFPSPGPENLVAVKDHKEYLQLNMRPLMTLMRVLAVVLMTGWLAVPSSVCCSRGPSLGPQEACSNCCCGSGCRCVDRSDPAPPDQPPLLPETRQAQTGAPWLEAASDFHHFIFIPAQPTLAPASTAQFGSPRTALYRQYCSMLL
jgi:hypothetical protein